MWASQRLSQTRLLPLLALALAEHALKARDTVSFLGFSQEVHYSVARTRNLAPLIALRRGDPILRPRDVESDYSLIPAVIPQLANQRSIVVLLSDLSKPSVQEALLKNLEPVCRKHLTLSLGLINEEQDLRSIIQRNRTENLKQEEFSQVFYSYWLNRRLALFSKQFSKLGGAAICLPEQHWMNAALRVYGGLRDSVSA